MAFKTAKQYNEEKFGGLFLLRNDGDYADVIFLYRGFDDVLIADTHYIKSSDYSGYVHCTGRGCPACAKGIRVQNKLFIPMYNLMTDQIEFWDRNARFETQLSADVFEKTASPCDYVYRIRRHGAAGDVNTTYEIQLVGKNTEMSYQDILEKFHIQLPEYYSSICRDVRPADLTTLINASQNQSSSSSESYGDLPNYRVTPRGSSTPAVSSIPDVVANVPGTTSDESDYDDVESPDF